MAQSAMAGSGPNAHAKANNNSAVKAHLQSTNQSAGNGNGNGNGTTRHSAPTDVTSVAPMTTNGGGVSNANETPAANGNGENAVSLKHDPGLATEWSAEEQFLLEEALNKHACQTNSLVQYIKIAAQLNEKTVRDVALRVRWMTERRRMGRDEKTKCNMRLRRPRTERTKQRQHQSHCLVATLFLGRRCQCIQLLRPSTMTTGSIMTQLEENVQVIAQIRSNLASMKMQENTDLLVRFRDNIYAILNGMTNMPGIMSQMPPLPVKLNTELADSILPKSSTPLLLQS